MIYHTRGELVTFSNIFYDANGVPTTVDSASATIVYPSSVPSGAILSHDPGQLKGKQTVPMVLQPDGITYLANWDSSISDPGTVFWSIKSGGTTAVIAEDGSFILRGNLANIES